MKNLVLPDIEAYAEQHSIGESDVCRRLREDTYRTMDFPHMVVGPLEGAFLKMMVQVVQATRVLEIGMFTGYSALAMAEALPAQGQLTTCEIDPASANLAQTYFLQSPHGNKIDIRLGPALDSMKTLPGPFDLIFIDADKANYVNYYRRAKALIAPAGMILIDNVLWSGKVVACPAPDASTLAIQELNRTVSNDPDVMAVMVTIRDGVLMVRPRTS